MFCSCDEYGVAFEITAMVRIHIVNAFLELARYPEEIQMDEIAGLASRAYDDDHTGI